MKKKTSKKHEMRSWQRDSQEDRRKQKNETTIRNAKKGNSKKWGKKTD